MSIKVQPCKNNVGAEISFNLKTAEEKDIKKIKDALNGFGVVFFRNQNLDSKSYIKFAKNFPKLQLWKEKHQILDLVLENSSIQILAILKILPGTLCY